MLFSVKNLSFSFHNFALKDISFTLKKGEILGIIGESGSGKTLLSLRILGLLENVCQSKGEIIFNQNRIESMQKFLGKEIAYIPQEPLVALNPLHKIKKQVVEILALHNPKMPKSALESRFAELMQMVDLDLKFSEVYPYELSGGQRQRVLMAIALANNPKIIIADEPTTALDSVLQKQILDLLRGLSQRLEIAVILITHNIAVVRHYADKIILLKNGEMVGKINSSLGTPCGDFGNLGRFADAPVQSHAPNSQKAPQLPPQILELDSSNDSAESSLRGRIADSPEAIQNKNQSARSANPCKSFCYFWLSPKVESPLPLNPNLPIVQSKQIVGDSRIAKMDSSLRATRYAQNDEIGLDCHENSLRSFSRNDESKGKISHHCEANRRFAEAIQNNQSANSSIVSEKSGLRSHEQENKTDCLLTKRVASLPDLSPQDEFATNDYFKELIDATHFSYHNPNLSDEILLEVRNLSVFHTQKKRLFGKNTIKKTLHNVNFTLKKGEILGIIGESGSGKSTLALALLKLIAYSGDITFKNQNYQNIPNFRAFRKNIQIVFQDPNSSINPRFRIKDIIKEGLNIHFKNECDKDKKVVEILRFVGLDESKLPCFPRELSGGQRQRVAIARALILNPQILILDEPTSALDKITQKQVLSLLLRLKDEFGLSYILITHDLGIISALCDNIIVLKDGEIVEKGDRFMLQSPQNPYTKSLVESIL